MLAECWAIVLIVLIMSYVFLRMGKQAIALSVLPLVILPLGHIIARRAGILLSQLLPIAAQEGRIFVDVVALVLGVSIIGAIAHKIKDVLFRRMYVFLCGGFSIILACIMISRILHP